MSKIKNREFLYNMLHQNYFYSLVSATHHKSQMIKIYS